MSPPDALGNLLQQVAELVTLREAHRQRMARLAEELDARTHELAVLQECNAAFEVLLTKTGEASLQRIEALVTYGLRVVFTDLQLTFKFAVEHKRGGLAMEPRLIDEAKGVEAPILDAFGGGPASVVSLLLRVIVCKQLNLAPVLLLDEPFAFVSAEYRAAVGQLLKQLADQTGLTIVMVSHEPEFLQYAHHGYAAKDLGTGTTFVGVE